MYNRFSRLKIHWNRQNKNKLFDISKWKVYVRNVANYLEKCFILFLFSEYLRDPILILNQETLRSAALVITLMKRIQN